RGTPHISLVGGPVTMTMRPVLCWAIMLSLSSGCQKAKPEETRVLQLTAQLAHSDSTIERLEAAKELGDFGSTATKAIPALTHALGDPHPDVRISAVRALVKIASTTPLVRKALSERLRSEQ